MGGVIDGGMNETGRPFVKIRGKRGGNNGDYREL